MSAPVVISSVSSCDLASQVSTVSRIVQSIQPTKFILSTWASVTFFQDFPTGVNIGRKIYKLQRADNSVLLSPSLVLKFSHYSNVLFISTFTWAQCLCQM